MRKIYVLEGIDCANCASKMADNLNKVEGINKANLNFITSKLIVDFDENKISNIDDKVNKAIHKIDCDVIIKGK